MSRLNRFSMVFLSALIYVTFVWACAQTFVGVMVP